MKSIIALLGLVVLFGSCQNHKLKKESGSFYAMVYIGIDTVPRGPFLVKYHTQGIIDSNGKAIQDTSCSIRDAIDTARDANKKPIYDSVKRTWAKVEHWVDITETSNPPKSMVQVCPIPKSRLHFFTQPIK